MKTWTYVRPLDRPQWVKDCTELRGVTLLLVRQSGAQEIRPGETIMMTDDGEIIHEVEGALT